MIRPKNASIECRESIVGKSAANDEQITGMVRAAAKRGVLMFDLNDPKMLESDRLFLRSLFKRRTGVTEIGGPV